MNLIHVPGYLSENGESPVATLVHTVAASLGHHCYTLNWRSGDTCELLSRLLPSAAGHSSDISLIRLASQIVIQWGKASSEHWSEKRRVALETGVLLADLLKRLRKDTILTSFSNGGYVVNVALTCLNGHAPPNLRKIIQIAPATDAGSPFPKFIETTPLYCIHSKHDLVLKLLYQFVQDGTRPAGAYGYADKKVRNVETHNGHIDADHAGLGRTLERLMKEC